MSSAAKLAYFWRSAASGLKHTPFVHFIAVLTVAIALFSTGLVRSAAMLLDALLASLGGEVEVTVYLDPGSTPAAQEALRERVQRLSGGEVRRVTPEAAMARLTAELGDLGGALSSLRDNPLPPSLEVEVPEDRRGPEPLRALAQELRGLGGVTGVDYGEQAVERLSALARGLRIGGLAAFAVVVIATVVIISATLQLAIYARREEIEIQKLVGATNRFVKVPFLIEGLLQGALGALVALAALWGFARLAGPTLAGLFGFLLAPGVDAAPLQGRLALELFVAGCALGLFGSLIAVGRFLRA